MCACEVAARREGTAVTFAQNVDTVGENSLIKVDGLRKVTR